MFRLFECCALSFFERFVLSFSLKIERFVSDSAEIWICGLYRQSVELAEVHNVSQADNFEVRDEAQQVRHIIARLPVQQQKIVTLRDVKGCSYEEIEQVTGLNATNVRVLLSRARKKIREEFNKWSNYESRGN